MNFLMRYSTAYTILLSEKYIIYLSISMLI